MAIKFEKTAKGQALSQIAEQLTPGQLEKAAKLLDKMQRGARKQEFDKRVHGKS